MRHLLKLTDLSRDDFFRILDRSRVHTRDRTLAGEALVGKNIALLFQKHSTRTRISATVAIMELGGNAVSLDPSAMQIERGESLEDTAQVLSRYVNALIMRAASHDTLEALARTNALPVINGLTDRHHPCQALADYLTMEQHGFAPGSGTVLAFIGEGNNVFNSLALGALFTGARLRIACPSGYEPRTDIVQLVRERGVELEIFDDPVQAVRGAQVVYTDVWVSMGQENETEARQSRFAPYCITTELLRHTADNHIVLHCLPAHRGEEITDDVMNKYGKIIFQQAENRLHVQKAVLEWVFEVL